MADAKLILQIDDLDHKLLSVDSEVAVNESFDVLFEGLSDEEVGSTAQITLSTLFSNEVIWREQALVESLDGFPLGLFGCKINTQAAADLTRVTSAKVLLTLVLVDSAGNRTVYGTARMRLHPGYSEGGEPLKSFEGSLDKHNVDPEAHKELIQSLRDADTTIRSEIDEKIGSHGNAEVEARNQAIGEAVNQAKDEMANVYKGDLTDFANAAATSARASASSAKAAAIAADKTVEKLGEAYEVVKTLNGKISQVDGKVDVAGRYAEGAVGAAGRANRSAERAVGAEENIGVYVMQVGALAAGIKQDADRAAGVVGTVTEAKTAVGAAKQQVEGLAKDVEGNKQAAVNAATAAGGSAKRAEEAEGRISGVESRVTQYVDTTLPQKVAEAIQSIDGKVDEVNTALGGKITSANTAIDGKVSQAKQAKEDAEKAQAAAEASATRAEIALNNGCVYEVDAGHLDGNQSFTIDKTTTIYRQTLSEASYDFDFDLSQIEGVTYKAVVFWLLFDVGATAPQVTFPVSVTWLSEPSFGANTQTLLAFMTVDGGASYVANVQWEKPL